ncbi:MAG TPA: TetR/AcrR family transcriptional regulator [Actinomycetaceae bacterium]|nr:TetR/AcrR family transcriptional regulator [Actinomycetaceae bacterium]
MPRIVDHASRRTEIVHALWAVIHEKGLDSVSFRAVAEAAGVSIGRIQHYFTSKEELIREGCAQLVAAAETQYAEVPEDAGPRRTLWHLVASPIPSTQPRRIGAAVWYAYLAKSVSEPALREIIAGAVDTARTEATGLLHAAREEADGGADGASGGADGADGAGTGTGGADGVSDRPDGAGARADSASSGVGSAGSRIEREALALLALGDGLAQRVMVGALDGEDAVAVLAEEFERRDLAMDGELATWRRVTS